MSTVIFSDVVAACATELVVGTTFHMKNIQFTIISVYEIQIGIDFLLQYCILKDNRKNRLHRKTYHLLIVSCNRVFHK
jgi:hypothetical protein